jgi:hypothetical protein
LAADGHAEDSSAPESRVSADGPLLDAELANIDRRLWEPPAGSSTISPSYPVTCCCLVPAASSD